MMVVMLEVMNVGHDEEFLHTSQKLLHTETFAQRSLYTKAFYTQKFLHREKSLHRRVFREVFNTQKLLHREVFTQRRFYTQTDTFTHRNRGFYTEKFLHR